MQLTSTGAWVLARRGQNTKMVRLPNFPHVDKTPRRFVVTAPTGTETIVGPSSNAPGTGNVLPPGTEGRSEMVWTIESWPGERGKGGTRFVLLEQVGWVKLKVTRTGGQSEAQDDENVRGASAQFLQDDDILQEISGPFSSETQPLAAVEAEVNGTSSR